MDPDSAEVKAAGCVVWRRAAGGRLEIAVVHRPRYDDWSLPKGKLDPGEGWAQAAVREVEEEIGVRGELGAELDPVGYRDHKDRAKVVRYWLMEARAGGDGFRPGDEVDELVWAEPARAVAQLSYEVDRATVSRALEVLS